MIHPLAIGFYADTMEVETNRKIRSTEDINPNLLAASFSRDRTPDKIIVVHLSEGRERIKIIYEYKRGNEYALTSAEAAEERMS